jgi:hypothetical protein
MEILHTHTSGVIIKQHKLLQIFVKIDIMSLSQTPMDVNTTLMHALKNATQMLHLQIFLPLNRQIQQLIFI